MKLKSNILTADGFDTIVAEKMPRIKRLEDTAEQEKGEEREFLEEEYKELSENRQSLEGRPGRESEEEFLKEISTSEQSLDVTKLIEDLHNQLLSSNRIRRALELDIVSHQKTIHQLIKDNKDLKLQIEDLKEELKRFKDIHFESVYLKEENEDALEKIHEFKEELRETKETLAKVEREKEELLKRIRELESQMGEKELFIIKGKMKEREASHFYEENQELQNRLNEALAQNLELEKKYESLKRSFHEVKESLTMLRDSCKNDFYQSSENLE